MCLLVHCEGGCVLPSSDAPVYVCVQACVSPDYTYSVCSPVCVSILYVGVGVCVCVPTILLT